MQLSQAMKQLPQPLGFFHVITGGDALHYGYWAADEQHPKPENLYQAQLAHSRLIFDTFVDKLQQPTPKVLDVGCGLGLSAGELAERGCQVDAIAPSAPLIEYARHFHPGPNYIDMGFLDSQTLPGTPYDIILFQESLQYFTDLDAVFAKANQLLKDDGRLVMCDEVSYQAQTKKRSAVHLATDIEAIIHTHHWQITQHQKIGEQVTPTCDAVIQGFVEKKTQMLQLFGAHYESQIDFTRNEWHNLKDWYQRGVFGYEVWVLQKA